MFCQEYPKKYCASDFLLFSRDVQRWGAFQESFNGDSRQQGVGFFANVDENFFKAAAFLVRTVVARLVKFLRHAGHQSDRPVEQAMDLCQGDLARLLDQTVTAF